MSEQEEVFKTKVETAMLDFLDEADRVCKEAKITVGYLISDKSIMEVFAQWIFKQTKSNSSVSTATS